MYSSSQTVQKRSHYVLYVHMYVRVYVRMYVCMYVCMYNVRMYVHMSFVCKEVSLLFVM